MKMKLPMEATTLRMRAIRIKTILVLAVCGIAVALPARGVESGAKTSTYEVVSPKISITLSGDGEIVSSTLGKDRIERSVHGQTSLAGFTTSGKVTARKLSNGGVEFRRTLQSDKQTQKCVLIDRFTPTKNSIRWEVQISSDDSPWSTSINTGLHYPASSDTKFWTAWSDPNQVSETNNFFIGYHWSDPLTPMPLKDLELWYGSFPFEADNPREGWVPAAGEGRIFGIPMATFLEEGQDLGLSLVLSPEDPTRELSLTTTTKGDLVFARSRNRLGEGRTVEFGMDIVSHEADWRGGLGWITRRYPKFFNPVIPVADKIAGCGAYSIYDGILDVEKLKKMAFSVIWKASYEFPYQGMYQPPVRTRDDEWIDSLGQKMSSKKMDDYDARMRKHGFYVLEYFNVTEAGDTCVTTADERRAALKDFHVNWAAAGWAPVPSDMSMKASVDDSTDWGAAWTKEYKKPDVHHTPDPTLPRDRMWENPVDYMFEHMLDGVLFHPNGYSYIIGSGIATDPGGPNYQRCLLEQAQRMVDRMPNSSGIAIDRLDPVRLYNPNADDGGSWLDGRPARFLVWSWNDVLGKMGAILHKGGKVIFINNHVKRLDMLRGVDGLFDEFGSQNDSLNTTVVQGVCRPVIAWTYDESALQNNPDAFFQKHLYLGAFPMAPFPENDHSILPSEFADKWYLDYGPLLSLMRGRKWVLESHAVTAENQAAKVNLFTVPDGYVMPVTFGGDAASITVTIRNVAKLKNHLSQYTCRALHPGSEEWIPVKTVVSGEKIVLDVPLKRGCAMVRFSKKAY